MASSKKKTGEPNDKPHQIPARKSSVKSVGKDGRVLTEDGTTVFICYMAVQSGSLSKFHMIIGNNQIRILSIKSGREKGKVDLRVSHVKMLS